MSGRRITTAVTLLVLVVVLAGMAVYGYRSLTSPLPRSSSEKKACSGSTKQINKLLKRSEVQVSVFNAGSRSGLASSTLDKLEALGFRAGNAGNAPGTAQVPRAVVWTTRANDPAATLVARALGARTQVEVTKTDLGPGVDVLVGDRFRGLDAKAPTQIRLAEPIRTCVPAS